MAVKEGVMTVMVKVVRDTEQFLPLSVHPNDSCQRPWDPAEGRKKTDRTEYKPFLHITLDMSIKARSPHAGARAPQSTWP